MTKPNKNNQRRNKQDKQKPIKEINDLSVIIELTKGTTKTIDMEGVGRFRIRSLNSVDSADAMAHKEHMHARTIFHGVLNKHGKKMFSTDDDFETIKKLPAELVVQLGAEIMSLSALKSIKDVEEK